MANTTVSSDLRVKKYLSEFFEEYVRKARFSKYTGTSNNNVITIKEDKKQIVIPLVTRLKGAGVSGSSTLRGNGERISNYGLTLTPTYKRHAVEFDQEELDKPAFDLMESARPLLMEWAKQLQRDEIIEAMGAIYDGTTYSTYGAAAASALDTWLTNNSDRILYGAAKSNTSAGNHTTSLGNIDTTNDKLDAEMVSLAKRIAQTADPHIRPLMAQEDDETFIMFCDPYAFRDLKTDATITQAQREAWDKGKSNPLFTGGDLLWDNVIIREIPEISTFIDGDGSGSAFDGAWGSNSTADGLNDAGNGGSRVGVAFLCGQQAVSYGLGQRPTVKVDKDWDYGFQPGVAIQMKHEIRKSYFNSIQHGIVTVFCSAAADS